MLPFTEIKARRRGNHLFSRTFIDFIGVPLTVIGFLLVLLSVISNSTTSLQSVYFIKVNQVLPVNSGQFSMTFGMYNYCVYQGNSVNCIEDDGIMIVPYDVNLTNKFNATLPQLFLNATPPDQNYDPFARPDPPHDSHLYVASVLCLLSSGGSIVLCIMKFIYRNSYKGYQDIYFSRGFLAAMSASIALLLIALSSTMYPIAVNELNATYPNIEVTLGPCVAMQGAAFMVFFLSSMCLLRGCGDKIEPPLDKLEAEYSQL